MRRLLFVDRTIAAQEPSLALLIEMREIAIRYAEALRLASNHPAERATRVDPSRTLRSSITGCRSARSGECRQDLVLRSATCGLHAQDRLKTGVCLTVR